MATPIAMPKGATPAITGRMSRSPSRTPAGARRPANARPDRLLGVNAVVAIAASRAGAACNRLATLTRTSVGAAPPASRRCRLPISGGRHA
jgi:hypothetical protein